MTAPRAPATVAAAITPRCSQRGIARAEFEKVADVYAAPGPDGSIRVDLYGVSGVAPDLLSHAA
jgi:hypothetical protein